MDQIRPFPPTDLIDQAEEEEAIRLAPAADLNTKLENGEMRDRVEVMKDLSGVLAQMPAYQANAYANSLGIDQNTLLAMRDGKFVSNMEKYQKIQEQLGMNDELTKSGNEFMTEYRDLTMVTKTGFQVIVMQAGKALIPILRLLNQLIQAGISAFSQLNPEIKNMLGVGLRFAMLASLPVLSDTLTTKNGNKVFHSKRGSTAYSDGINKALHTPESLEKMLQISRDAYLKARSSGISEEQAMLLAFKGISNSQPNLKSQISNVPKLSNVSPPKGNPNKEQLYQNQSNPNKSSQVTIHQEFKTDMTINGAKEPIESANAVKRQQENSMTVMARNAKGFIV